MNYPSSETNATAFGLSQREQAEFEAAWRKWSQEYRSEFRKELSEGWQLCLLAREGFIAGWNACRKNSIPMAK